MKTGIFAGEAQIKVIFEQIYRNKALLDAIHCLCSHDGKMLVESQTIMVLSEMAIEITESMVDLIDNVTDAALPTARRIEP